MALATVTFVSVWSGSVNASSVPMAPSNFGRSTLAGLKKTSISAWFISLSLTRAWRGAISFLKLLPTWAKPTGSLILWVLKRSGESTKMLWQVSGRRYASSWDAPTPTLNIMLNLFVPDSLAPHFWHLTLFFSRSASYSASESFSGTCLPVFSSMSLSGRKADPQLAQRTKGSVKLARWPDASKTFLGRMVEPSISTIPSFLTRSFLQSSTYLFFMETPRGP